MPSLPHHEKPFTSNVENGKNDIKKNQVLKEFKSCDNQDQNETNDFTFEVTYIPPSYVAMDTETVLGPNKLFDDGSASDGETGSTNNF